MIEVYRSPWFNLQGYLACSLLAYFAGVNPFVGAAIGAAIGMGLSLIVSFGME